MISITRASSGPQDTAAAGSAGEAAAEGTKTIEDVIITGSRIPGAPQASPITVITSTDIANAGQTDLGQVIRDLPQNFGGTNPSAGQRNSPNQAVFGGQSQLNLRGIGPDATLTLLNGHRLTTDLGGVDITAIPSDAVSRLEVETDGASALYGADAVGGVANIITKTNFQGLTATALYGGSTDGGFEEKQYSIIGGKSWEGGNVLVSLSNTSNSAITAAQRSYTSTDNPATDIYPDLHIFNAFLSANQDIGNHAHVSIDAIYSDNVSNTNLPQSNEPFLQNGIGYYSGTPTIFVAPSFKLSLPADWTLSGYGTYGTSGAHFDERTYSNGLMTRSQEECSCYTSDSAELSAEGPLLSLPAGNVRLAAGGGYRSLQFTFTELVNGLAEAPYSGTNGTYYGFGELSVPVIAPSQNVPFIRSITASTALRYEDSDAVGSSTTPKFGIVYEINESITVKASWGKSFKAPTPAEQFSPYETILFKASTYIPTAPAGTTLLFLGGGNPNLKPEKATTTTVTGELHPSGIPALRITVDYFHINFVDRVLQAIPTISSGFNDPQYSSLLTLNPSANIQAEDIAAGKNGFINTTGVVYNPASVIGLLDDRYENIAGQVINGLDVLGSYEWTLTGHDRLNITSSSSYIDLKQQLVPGSPSIELAGNFYEPRHFKSRTGITWRHDSFTLSSFLNYEGSAKYRTITPPIDIKSNTAIDLVGKWATPKFYNSVVTLTILNLLNSKPTQIPGLPYQSSYDATAYDAVGRAITLAISKSF